tara:strand:+ start:179 stop:454 length:276 start_codon:yes stop_codon:yes gene_type:complete
MNNKMKYKPGGELKAVPSDNKGLAKLPTAVRNKMGYAQMGTEMSLLNKMSMGGSMDMVDMLEKKSYGGSAAPSMMSKKNLGGSSSNTYSGD